MATFSVSCDQSAYVALDDVNVASSSTSASTPQATVTAYETTTAVSTEYSQEILSELSTTTSE